MRVRVFVAGLVSVGLLSGCIIRSSEPVAKEKSLGRVLDDLFASGRVLRHGDEVEEVKKLTKKWDSAARSDVNFDDLKTFSKHVDDELVNGLIDAIIRGGDDAIAEFKRPVVDIFNDIDVKMSSISRFRFANTQAGEALVKEIDGDLDELWKRVALNHFLSEAMGEGLVLNKVANDADVGFSLRGDEFAAKLRVASSDIIADADEYSKTIDKWQKVTGSLSSKIS